MLNIMFQANTSKSNEIRNHGIAFHYEKGFIFNINQF